MSSRRTYGQTSRSGGYYSDKILYNGLWNQGSTCYLNSVLQVLFMTKEFRENLKVPRYRDEDQYIIDQELRELFGELKKYTSGTLKITKKLEIRDVREQRDAAEYFEKILCLTSYEASKVFHGELINRNTCSKCQTDNDISAAFWCLPLALVDSPGDYSVLKGVEDLFRPSELSGENQMYCERCDDKSDATITCVVERHPEVLVLLLKRFEFDTRYMCYRKLDCAVDVPFKLQIPQDQTYELFAFVDHFGSLRSGHYTTTIRSQDDDRWYMFDDDRVSLCHYQRFQVDPNETLYNAYLLFYRKVVPADTSPQDVGVVSTPGVQRDEVGSKTDGLETEETEVPPTTNVDIDAAASIPTKSVLKRPGALPECPCNHDDKGDDGGDIRQNKPWLQQDRDEDKDRGRTHIERQKGGNDENYRSVNDQWRMKAAEGVKNDGLGGQSDPQNTLHDFMPYVPESQTRWGKREDTRDETWVKMEEKRRSEAEDQKNEELHHVPHQRRPTSLPDSVKVRRPSEDKETDAEENSAGTSSAQVDRGSHEGKLNREVKTWTKERHVDVSSLIYRHYKESLRAADVNRDNGEDGDDRKTSEKLGDVRENGHDDLKANEEGRGQYEKHEHDPDSNLRKAGDLEQTGTSDEWKSPKEGIRDSSGRREDQRDGQGHDGGARRRGGTYGVRKRCESIEGDELRLNYELIKPKQGELNERKGAGENANQTEQRSRRTSERDTSRSDNHQRNRSPGQRFSPTRTGSVGKGHGDGRYESGTGRPPTDGRRRVKSETDAQNNTNYRVRPETQSGAQDALNSHMKSLRVTEKPAEGVEGPEPEANGKHQAKRKNDGSGFSFLCCKKYKQIESEDV